MLAFSMGKNEGSEKLKVRKYEGLSTEEAKKKLSKFGPNVLPETPPPSDLTILIEQLKEPLVYILFLAGMVTFLLNEIPDTIIIAVAVFTNTILSFIQERKASRALYALKKLVHPTAKVIRDGMEVKIKAENIVPGDVVILNQGDKIPADGALIEANRLFVDEAILTGESVPVEKKAYLDRLEIPQTSLVAMGTIVASGNGLMVVKKTGEDTEIGKIAESIQQPSEETPLKNQLERFSKQLIFLVVGLTIFVFVVGVWKKMELAEVFKVSVALAVSSIPEGILVGLTIVLAIGMQRILKKRGLVRNLISAETLGGVTTICIDKTGTLTEGKMQVVDFLGNASDLSDQMILANDHDDPIVVAAYDWAVKKKNEREKEFNVSHMIRRYDRLDSIPFSSEEKYFASLHKWEREKNIIFVNGAPEFLLERSKLENKDRKEILQKIEELTKRGKRVVGLGRKIVSGKTKKLLEKEVNNDLEWVGILAFSDPIREGVKEALRKTNEAGIKLIVITGDYPQTAVAVMNQLGIHTCKDCLMLGNELEEISMEKLSRMLSAKHRIGLFARTTPSQKLKIVESLKRKGEVIAMMGDGVNDAPALKKADIGIVVGESTEVAKESADLVLLDSSFATIVTAIEEGRGIFDNIRKIILYLMSDSFEEIFAVVGAIVLGLPLPITAAQILWINLVSDGFPDMALTVDSKQSGIMDQPPRSPTENLVSGWMRHLILIVSIAGGIMALLIFIYVYKTTGDLILSQSVAFATLGVNSLVYVFSIRTLTRPFWVENPFDNGWLNLSVIGGLLLQFLPFTTEKLRNFFNLHSLSLFQWGWVFAASVLMFIIIEGAKVVFRHKLIRG